MCVGKGNVKVVNVNFFANKPPGESTAASIPSFPLNTDSDYFPYLLATLLYCMLVLGPSERWGGGFEKVASAVLAFACVPGSTLAARMDDPLFLRGNTRRLPSK